MEKKEVQIDSLEMKDVTTVVTDQIQPVNVRTAATWPTEPKPLILSSKEQFIWALYDLILIIVPMGLIVKTGLVILAHHLDADNAGTYFDQATALSRYLISLNSQLVTLFTIIFVTIISTFVKRYALWKAQEGAYLSELEQFQGSISLPSTLKLIWSLRSFNVKSAVLVSVWAFYYLGSQAAKEEYTASNSAPFTNQYSIIQRPDAPSLFTPQINDLLNSSGVHDVVEFDFRDLNYRFANALLNGEDFTIVGENYNDAAMTNQGTNNGPLIPDFDTVLADRPTDSLADSLYQRVSGWVDVSQQSKLKGTYANLQGVLPILFDHPANETSTYYGSYSTQILGSYALSTSYLSVSCGDLQILPIEAFPNGTNYNSSLSLNMNSYRPNAPRDAAGHPLREFDFWFRGQIGVNASSAYANPDDDTCPGGTLESFASRGTCNVTTKHVDLKVSCGTTGCYARQMRWQNDTNEMAATSYSTPFDSEEFGNQFLGNLTLATGIPTEWVFDGLLLSFYISPYCGQCYLPSESISCSMQYGQDLGMTQVFNTYFTISQWSILALLNPTNLTKEQLLDISSDGVHTFQWVEGAPFIRAYRINWVWIPLDFAASLVLLAAALASWRLRMMTLAPDVFGYVSSMTRDNERVPLPTEGSMLSGIDRARMLKHVKVRIGEIHTASSSGESSVGVVGLAAFEANVLGLQQQRLYC